MIEPVLLTCPEIWTFIGNRGLTNASGFFFAPSDDRLFLITSRHVVRDEPQDHAPDRLVIALHLDLADLSAVVSYAIPLYGPHGPVWREGGDRAGAIDVAAIEIDRERLPERAAFRAFTPANLLEDLTRVQIGAPLLILGFPLGFHDTRHHLPVARHAIVASAFGVRFQGEGFFLTDARTHRGSSGAPVIMKAAAPGPERAALGYTLLGVHSSRFDMGSRDLDIDEALGLNCAWYADILMTLTAG